MAGFRRRNIEDIEFQTIAKFFATIVVWLVVAGVCKLVANQADTAHPGKLINDKAVYDSSIILGLSISIMLVTGFWGQLKNSALKRASGVDVYKLDRVFEAGTPCLGTYVVLLMTGVIMVYAIAYSRVIGSIHEEADSLHYIVVTINAVAVSAILFVTIRYAEYIRLLTIAHTLSKDFEKFTTADGDHGPALELNDLRDIHDALAKRETMFEPPGSMFVVIGITGTFMGLALGLTTLPLHEILKVGQDQTIKSAEAGERALDLAMPFVRSMGLALGISTMGVIGSVAAQWLRGFSGPPVPTERVLERAEEWLKHQGKRPPTLEEAIRTALCGVETGNNVDSPREKAA